MYLYIYLLFGGVIKLILIGSTEALEDAGVHPQPLHSSQQLLGERLRVLHSTHLNKKSICNFFKMKVIFLIDNTSLN